MKKRLLVALAALFTSSVYAQLPVSTTPENKNVVLEEFTGIYCQYCPDGHRRAKEFADDNPGDVVLINVHTGGYAVPSGGDPDFRTNFGAALVSQTGLTGYPAGTINRHVFPGNNGNTILNRGQWASAGAQILNQSSYVNVALEGEVDFNDDTLTVNVEIYFTDSVAPDSVNLNVALLQNNVEGPQIGLAANPEQILPNGNYNHEHMLRHLLTGQWGEVIHTTDKGTLVQRTYKYALPADIRSIDLRPEDLEIAAFIAEGRQEVISGAMGPITYIPEPGVSFVDLEVGTSMTLPGYCDNSTTIEVDVTNNGTVAVDSFEVNYIHNNGAKVSEWITTALQPQASTTVSFTSPVSLSGGRNVFTFNVSVDGVMKYYDLTSENNLTGMSFSTLSANTIDTRLWEDFEDEDLGDFVSNQSIPGNTDEINHYAIDKSGVQNLNYEIGGFGKSERSLWWQMYTSEEGAKSEIIFGKIDLSNTQNATFAFAYAYSQLSALENSGLKISASADCGDTWTVLFQKSGSNLATAEVNEQYVFFPESGEWASETIDASAFDGESEVIVSFEVTMDEGNALYIDDIKLMDADQISVSEQKHSEANLSVYPNPVSSVVTISSPDFERENVELTITDLSGKVVRSFKEYGSEITIDLSDLDNGTYVLETTADGKSAMRKIVIAR